ncbi:class I SAM-dependent methyltransferase [candidate division FCPU426 bacterium]|nr:class I SAM-dependent methyltransferase [candidate division FCPU426 bacterium]
MIHLHEHKYYYLEEINTGITKQFSGKESGAGKKVLDVGCGSGALGEAISQKGYEVWGIESHPDAYTRAEKRLARLIKADLNDQDAIEQAVGPTRFDYIVFSDVLEHIYDPYSILRAYAQWIKPGGRLLISVPNAVVWTNRLHFLCGRFEYGDTGVMDRTHIRFFSFKSAKTLVKAAGFEVVKVDYTPYLVRACLPLIKRMMLGRKTPEEHSRRELIDSPAYRFYLRCIYPLEYLAGYFFKSLTAFRIIIVGRKKDD